MAFCCAWWRAGIPPTWLVVCGVLLVQIGWGLYPVMLKEFATEMNPLIFSFYRDFGAFPLLLFCGIIVERKVMIPRLKMILVFMVLGLTGMFGNQLLYTVGVFWAGPNVASAIQPIMPVWATIIAIASCTEKIRSPLYVHTWLKFLSIFLATGGAIEITVTVVKDHTHNNYTLLNNSTSHPAVNHHVLGYLALFGNTFCSATYLLLQKRFIFSNQDSRWKNHPIYVTAYSYFFGALFMGLASLYYVGSHQFQVFILNGTSVYALVYAIFISSAMCYLLITWSNMHLPATVVAAFWPVQVLVGVLASSFILKDKLAPLQYIGAVMLIFGLFLLLLSNHLKERLDAGLSIPRVDCHMTTTTTTTTTSEETQVLLPQNQIQYSISAVTKYS